MANNAHRGNRPRRSHRVPGRRPRRRLPRGRARRRTQRLQPERSRAPAGGRAGRAAPATAPRAASRPPRPAPGCSIGWARRSARWRRRSTWSTAFRDPPGRHAPPERAHQRRRAWCCRRSCRHSSPPIPTSASTSSPTRASSTCSPPGCDAGIRYDERLEQDMIAVPDRPPASSAMPRPRRRPTSIATAARTIRASCSTMPACAAASRAAPCRRGSSSATARW